MGKVSQWEHLPYPNLFTVVWVALVIAWCMAAKSTTDRVLLLALCSQAGSATEPLRVTNNDGTLSNGEMLRGWRNTAYFVAQCGLWMVGCAAFSVALGHLWPSKSELNEEGSGTLLRSRHRQMISTDETLHRTRPAV
jgi:hypothetical protein